MPDSSLIQYIKQTRERNVPDEVAKEKLLQAGWSYELVVEAFNYLNHKDDHIKILSKKNLSKMTIFALAISFLIPPLGMVLAYIAMRRLKNDE